MISLKEIGRICGLSESTVSKALKGNPAIRRSTAQRVAEVARMLSGDTGSASRDLAREMLVGRTGA